MMRTIEQAIQTACQCLREVGLEDPRMESEFLVAALLRMPRGHLILNRHRAISVAKLRSLQDWLGQRQKRKPLAYVTGEQPFREFSLRVNPEVLVPRPETELLVERAMMILDSIPLPSRETGASAISYSASVSRRCGRASGAPDEGWSVVDVGTGSGNIAISLSGHPKVGKVIAIDLSAEALKVARKNGKQNKRLPIDWLLGNLLEPVQKRGLHAHLIVANLPYVRTGDLSGLAPELQWEPRMALDGGADGLRLIEPCIEQAAEVLHPHGMLLLEIGADQSQDVASILKKHGSWSDIQVFRDLAGLPRLIQAERSAIGTLADPTKRSGGMGI
jgi:release factor glutamine methyltransferase